MNEKLGKDEKTELFLIQVRGSIAKAFTLSGITPTQGDWNIMRGITDPTMRDIGEIGFRTGCDMDLRFYEARTDE